MIKDSQKKVPSRIFRTYDSYLASGYSANGSNSSDFSKMFYTI
jgi:hypothetical protein